MQHKILNDEWWYLIILESIKTLEKKLDALEGIKSPGPSIKPVEVLEQISDEDDIEEIKKVENPKKKLRFSDSNEGDDLNEEEVEVLETPSEAVSKIKIT